MQESLDTSSLKDDACIAVGLDVISCENEEDELLAIGKYILLWLVLSSSM